MATPSATKTAPAASAPVSQRVKEAAISSGTITHSEDLTDLLRAELDHDGDAPARPAKPTPPTAEADDTPLDDADEAAPSDELDAEPTDPRAQLADEDDADYAARMDELDAEPTDPRAQLDGEDDADYAARMDELDAEPATKEKVSPALQKRFGELTGKIKALEAENTRLKATPAAPTRPASSFEEAVLAARSEEDLASAQTRFEQWEEFALTHPDGYEAEGKAGSEPVVYTAEALRDLLVQARRALRTVPKQAAFIGQLQASEKVAAKAFPAYADPDSPLSKTYAEIVQRAPALVRAVPDLKLFVADAMRGRALRTKGATPAALPGRPVARPTQPPSAMRGAPARAPRGPDTNAQQRLQARAKVEDTGSIDDLASALATRFGR